MRAAFEVKLLVLVSITQLGLDRTMPIQTPIKSRREFAWRSHIGIALHTVRDMIGVFLMNTGQCEPCEAIGRDLLVLRRGPWRQRHPQGNDNHRKGANTADAITIGG